MLLFGLCAGARAEIKSGDNPEASAVWQKVRASLFQSRPIAAATDDVISLEVPVRAEDAAIVPIAIKTRFPQTSARYVDKVYLIIDNNPSPISAVFQFTPLSGQADIETRVRIDEYTHVRAIAETNDGQLHMTTRFLKASGGCSAPPGKDAQAALATLGRMKFRVEGDASGGQPVLAQLMISHPNNSGLAMDQVTRLFTPAHFVRQVRITYGEPARDVGRCRFFDQREPELPLLLPAARRRRTEGRGGRLQRPEVLERAEVSAARLKSAGRKAPRPVGLPTLERRTTAAPASLASRTRGCVAA